MGRAKFFLLATGLGIGVCLLFLLYLNVTDPSPTSVSLSQPVQPQPDREPSPDAAPPFEAAATNTPMVQRLTRREPEISPGREQATPSATPGNAVEYAEIPTVFLDPDYASGQWTQDQLDVLYRLRQDFTTAVVSSNLSPTSPEYLEKWQEEQRISDQKFQAFFGTDAYLREQRRPK